LSGIFKKKGEIVARYIGGEFFLIPIRNSTADLGNVFVLQGCGRDVWKCIDGTCTSEEISRRICEQYEVDFKTASDDVSGLLADLSSANLVEKA